MEAENIDTADRLSELFSAVYFHCHPKFEVEISHQAVRAMQYIAMTGPTTINALSEYLSVAHNTTSEIVRRLQSKELVLKQRRHNDERVVEVRLTEDGKRVVLQHTGLDIPRLTEALKEMSQEECNEIERAFTTLLQALGGSIK